MMLNNPSAILTVKRSYLICRLAQYSNIEETIASFSLDDDTAFDFKPVCHREVLNELNSLRSDCSTGPDNIPAKLRRLVAEYLASAITNIINSYSESTIPLSLENRSYLRYSERKWRQLRAKLETNIYSTSHVERFLAIECFHRRKN